MVPAHRFYQAARAAARRVGLGHEVAPLLIRFQFPGLMSRIGVSQRAIIRTVGCGASSLQWEAVRSRTCQGSSPSVPLSDRLWALAKLPWWRNLAVRGEEKPD